MLIICAALVSIRDLFQKHLKYYSILSTGNVLYTRYIIKGIKTKTKKNKKISYSPNCLFVIIFGKAILLIFSHVTITIHFDTAVISAIY